MRKLRKSEINRIIKENAALSNEDYEACDRLADAKLGYYIMQVRTCVCKCFSEDWTAPNVTLTASDNTSRFDSLQIIHDLCIDYDGFKHGRWAEIVNRRHSSNYGGSTEMNKEYYISTLNPNTPIEQLMISGSIIPKVIAEITICGAFTIPVYDYMDWNPPTPEQVKNLKEMLNIDVKLIGEDDD